MAERVHVHDTVGARDEFKPVVAVDDAYRRMVVAIATAAERRGEMPSEELADALNRLVESHGVPPEVARMFAILDDVHRHVVARDREATSEDARDFARYADTVIAALEHWAA